jgi:hypothetical protein
MEQDATLKDFPAKYASEAEFKAAQEKAAKGKNPFGISDEEMNQLKKEFQNETDPIIQDMDTAHSDYMKKWGTWEDIPPEERAKIEKVLGDMTPEEKAQAARDHFNPPQGGPTDAEKKSFLRQWGRRGGDEWKTDSLMDHLKNIQEENYWKNYHEGKLQVKQAQKRDRLVLLETRVAINLAGATGVMDGRSIRHRRLHDGIWPTR